MEFFRLTRDSFPGFFTSSRVLEVGSLDINGSVRSLADSCEWIGLDLGAGPGVDVVVAAENYNGDPDSFDMTLSGECMEHNPEWQASVESMIRMLRPGGLFVLSCASPGRREHGTPRTSPEASPFTSDRGSSYYRNLSYQDFDNSDVLSGLNIKEYWINWRNHDLYIAGFKDYFDRDLWEQYRSAVERWISEVNTEGNLSMPERTVLRALGPRVGPRVLAFLAPATRLVKLVRSKIRYELKRAGRWRR